MPFPLAVEIDPSFANAKFNLGLVPALNKDAAGARLALSSYKKLISEKEAQNADELLRNLQQSLDAPNDSHFGSTGFVGHVRLLQPLYFLRASAAASWKARRTLLPSPLGKLERCTIRM